MLRLFVDKIRSLRCVDKSKEQKIPIIIFLILASASFAAYYFQSISEAKNIQTLVANDTANIRHTVEMQLNERLSALQRMASRWSAANGTPRRVW